MSLGSGQLSPAAAAAVPGYGAYGAGVNPAQGSRQGSGAGYRPGYRAASASEMPAGWRGDEGEEGGCRLKLAICDGNPSMLVIYMPWPGHVSRAVCKPYCTVRAPDASGCMWLGSVGNEKL